MIIMIDVISVAVSYDEEMTVKKCVWRKVAALHT